MFKKIIIAEDIDSINQGVTTLLEKNVPAQTDSAKYCDEAYQKIIKAIAEDTPFDLLITDLSFKADGKYQDMNSGEELITRLREEGINLKIIVYSIEDKPYLIRSLFNNNHINAFVVKGRDGSKELLEAMQSLTEGGIFISAQFANILREQPILELDQYDMEILKLLSEGLNQSEISDVFKRKEYPSPSTSSIEKKINKLKFMFKVQNSIHLVATAKDMRLI